MSVSSYAFGQFVVDLRAGALRRGDTALALRPKAFDVLVYLIGKRGEAVSKSELIDVPAEMIAAHGAVSEQVAAAMAEGVRRRLEADVAVSTTGIAGPTGGTDTKPVGTVCFGVSIDGRPTYTVTRRFPGDRERVRTLTTTAALHLVVAQLKRG